MPLVDVATAKPHLRVDNDTEDAVIERFLLAAEEQATAFLGRNVYADQPALTAAVAAAAAALAAASVAYDTAMAAAAALANSTEVDLKEGLAKDTYYAAIESWQRTVRGMVATESVKTAILLITASLWEHRGDEDTVMGIPPAAYSFLWPARTGLGV